MATRATTTKKQTTTQRPILCQIEMFRDTSGDWRWRLRYANGLIRADSGEGYRNKAECARAIAAVKRDMADAPIWETKANA